MVKIIQRNISVWRRDRAEMHYGRKIDCIENMDGLSCRIQQGFLRLGRGHQLMSPAHEHPPYQFAAITIFMEDN
jgi:hypothetical protein